MLSSQKKEPIQLSSTIPFAIKLNNGVRSNFFCFVKDHEMRLEPINTVIVDTLTIMKDGSIVKISKTC